MASGYTSANKRILAPAGPCRALSHIILYVHMLYYYPTHEEEARRTASRLSTTEEHADDDEAQLESEHEPAFGSCGGRARLVLAIVLIMSGLLSWVAVFADHDVDVDRQPAAMLSASKHSPRAHNNTTLPRHPSHRHPSHPSHRHPSLLPSLLRCRGPRRTWCFGGRPRRVHRCHRIIHHRPRHRRHRNHRHLRRRLHNRRRRRFGSSPTRR